MGNSMKTVSFGDELVWIRSFEPFFVLRITKFGSIYIDHLRGNINVSYICPVDPIRVGCGGSDDYMKYKGAKYVFTVEMTGGGSFGFDLPEKEIQPAVVESWEGLKAMAHYLIKENSTRIYEGSRRAPESLKEKIGDLMKSYTRGQSSPYAKRTRIE